MKGTNALVAVQDAQSRCLGLGFPHVAWFRV